VGVHRGALRGGPELGDVLDRERVVVRCVHPAQERPEVLLDDGFEHRAVPAEEVGEVVHVHAAREPRADDEDDGVEDLGGGGHQEASAASAVATGDRRGARTGGSWWCCAA